MKKLNLQCQILNVVHNLQSLASSEKRREGWKEKVFLVEVLSFDPQMSHAKDLWFSSRH